MAGIPSFGRLVRFENESGQIKYGEAGPDTDALTSDSLVGSSVEVYNGQVPWDPTFQKSGKHEVIHKVVAPLPYVPIFVCVGLNYRAHAEETKVDMIPVIPMCK